MKSTFYHPNTSDSRARDLRYKWACRAAWKKANESRPLAPNDLRHELNRIQNVQPK